MPAWLSSALDYIPDWLAFQMRASEKPGCAVAAGYGSHGEPVRCVRRKSGKIAELWLSATRIVPEDELAAEIAARYKLSAAHGVPGRARRRTRERSSRRHPARG
jgi:hypothetical protein